MLPLQSDAPQQRPAADSVVAREAELIRHALSAAAAYSQALSAARQACRQTQSAVAAQRTRLLADAAAHHQAEIAALDQRHQQQRHARTAAFEAEHLAIEQAAKTKLAESLAAIEKQERRARKVKHEAVWLAGTVFDARRRQLRKQLAQVRKQLQSNLRLARDAKKSADDYLTRIHQLPHDPPPPSPTQTSEQPAGEALAARVAEAQDAVARLVALRLPPFAERSSLLFMSIGIAGAVAAVVGWLARWNPLPWAIASVILAGASVLATVATVTRQARRQVAQEYNRLCSAVVETETLCKQTYERASQAARDERRQARSQRDAETSRATAELDRVLSAATQRREGELPQIESAVAAKLGALQARHESELLAADQSHQVLRAQLIEQHRSALEELEAEAREAELACAHEHELAIADAHTTWQDNQSQFQKSMADVWAQTHLGSFDWTRAAAAHWRPAIASPAAIRFGQLTLDLGATPPADSSSAPTNGNTTSTFALPALLEFPAQSSLLIEARDEGRQRAIELLRSLVLRMLLGLPPGKARVTFIDPVGLGQNFAAFMHLADHDPALISHRIWTEPAQIEQRLADLTEHMETIIQKYLRDEFPTLEDYNRAAGEIAEPYHLLVVANFPAGFTDAAARRLASIAATGPRCGVLTLMSTDTRLPKIPDFNLRDLEQGATRFSAKADRLVWNNPRFGALPLVVDPLPTVDELKRLLNGVGAAAVGAKRIEVPFAAIAPPADSYWHSDSRRGLDVPLGRSGASRLQRLQLGHGVSQHVLIAGKTGSGKSTLLHALIVNAALRYSPDELELYLIDFKKGVEFKTYVERQLPHARVVAIESEREFGLSVMQRLDRQMQERGETFRAAGVQDIAAYRDAGHSLPRVLFVVDEFQEFFTEDDRLAQQASLLLDRLVRQGRAFGIHVILGSQTLGGAYTLARSTLGQMAVRIALQCGETDAHLILSEDNSAARLLARPGEAIYNDANGLVEGNHPFQVVWLSDDQREAYLEQVRHLTEQRPPLARRRMLVFEGARPAAIEQNESLAALAARPAPPTEGPPSAWLGEPLALEEIARAPLERRAGANLLMIGQNAEAAAGMMTSALLSLRAQCPLEKPARFFVLDGGANSVGIAPLAALVGAGDCASADDAPQIMAALAAELAARQEGGDATSPIYLLIFDLPRMRALRSRADDFSFSRADDQPTSRPDAQFADILREGPALGVHTLLWCDTLTAFQRMLDRQGLREFNLRVLLQMSATDSSLLIDSPTAGQLGRSRAILHIEDEGRQEKFRPFAPPAAEWLRGFARCEPAPDSLH
jgi:ABC-type multidrug transport system fused ATPase/permease subunit